MEPRPHATDDQLAQSAWVRRLAHNLLRDPGLAEDAAQEGAIAAWRHGPLDSHAQASWLATAVRRFAGRLRRGEQRRALRERAVARDEALPSTAELVERAEAHRALVAAVLGLEEPYRSTILLRYVEDLAPRAIARRAGIPVATVKTRIARGLERLRRELGREHGDARAWLGLLVPLANPFPAAPLLLGTTLVKTLKISLAALLVLLLAFVGFLALRPERDAAVVATTPSTHASERSTKAESALEAGRVEAARLGLDSPHANSAGAENSAAPESERLTGRVLDLAEKPIVGARVSALHSPSDGFELFDGALEQPARELVAAESDAEGRFALELPYGMLVELRASATGFAGERLTTRFGGGELVIHLGASAAVTGLVSRAADGSAVVGALVRVWAGAEEAIERVLHTDEFGRYRAEDLPPGKLGLIVVPEQDSQTRYEELELAPGQVLQHDIVVGTGQSVGGRVLDQRTRAPIEGAEVSANDFVYKTVKTDAHGEFEIAGLLDRGLTLEARAPGYGRTELRVLEAGTAVELLLQPGRRASGRVLARGGQPLAGAFVAALANDFAGGAQRSDVQTSSTGADGRFELGDLRPDLPHVLLVRASGYGTTFRAIPSDAARSDLGDLVLDAAAALEGRVLDEAGAPLAGLSVVLRPAALAPGLQLADLHGRRGVTSDATGRFVFRELAAGDWTFQVHSLGQPPLAEERLQLSPGEFRRGFDVRIGAELAIEGWVGDERGHALAEVGIRATPEDGSHGDRSISTDAEGRFRIAGLQPGRYTLLLRGPRTETETLARQESLRELHVAAGTRALELRLVGRSSSIRGRVLDADGRPLAGAFVSRLEDGSPPDEFVLSDAEGRFEIPVAPQARVELLAQPGLPLARSLRTPTYAEFRAGRVVAENGGRCSSPRLQPGSAGIELRLEAPR